jgi:uncharacterized caspase-like protein
MSSGLGRGIALCVAAAALLSPVEAAAEKRVALVVGMSDYISCPKLENPQRDAAGMAKALTSVGFDVVTSVNQDLSGLTAALEQFYAKAAGADAAVFYYAGHGLQARGVNYLVPTDAQLKNETRLKQETIALQDVVSSMEEKARITLAFVDACRDNPMADELKRSIAGSDRSAAVLRGLAPMSIRSSDTMVVYATAPNKTAQDGSGQNSPFTEAMVRNIATPGVDIELMMKRVTRDVAKSTEGAQIPERLSRLTSEFVFNEAVEKPGEAPSPQSASASNPGVASPGNSASTDLCRSDNPPLSCLWNTRKP